MKFLGFLEIHRVSPPIFTWFENYTLDCFTDFIRRVLQDLIFSGMPSSGLVWYLNGKLAPEVWIQRGLTYSIYVHGGNNPHSAEFYNPFIITDEPHGGYERLTDQAQKQVKVLAGVQFTLRGQPRPIAGNVVFV